MGRRWFDRINLRFCYGVTAGNWATVCRLQALAG